MFCRTWHQYQTLTNRGQPIYAIYSINVIFNKNVAAGKLIDIKPINEFQSEKPERFDASRAVDTGSDTRMPGWFFIRTVIC